MSQPQPISRPYTTAILASSLDGCLARADARGQRIASAYDFQHLEQQVAQVDAVLFGATTLRLGGTAMRLQSSHLIAEREHQGRSPQPLQIVCSASGELDLNLPFFRQPIPRALLTTEKGASRWQGSTAFDHCWCTRGEAIDWPQAFAHLQASGVQTLAVLGGGQLFASLLQIAAIDELWLTLCPLLLGSAAPRLYPEEIPCSGRLSLLNVLPVGNEVYLHYRLSYP
ncbi:MAG TPA: RibD family protein [Thermosynechococcus sp. M3746_W2019_013]|uniref:RibD family protein n=1 Tax=Thermosynechococcus sp. M3746_W2019_013 TaxID=2747806 RepID=UPI0019DB66D7|nr:RibD family protein [Thermosynechococcus sp. M3746_W2019_013]HIK23615.1 RibD family protein [Thermosynechococcus sp. M3746_W2019_013]